VPIGAGGDDLLEKAFGFGGLSHEDKVLGETRAAIQRIGIEVQAFLIEVDRFLVAGIEPSRIAGEKPELRIVGRGLRGAARQVQPAGVVAALKRLLRSARESRVLDVRAPAEVLALISWFLLARGCARAKLVSLRLHRAAYGNERQCDFDLQLRGP